MLELVVCKLIDEGYKVVIPKNVNLRILKKYAVNVYTHPSEVKEGDNLKFVSWISASDEDRRVWRGHL